jgi:hypothetical protein
MRIQEAQTHKDLRIRMRIRNIGKKYIVDYRVRDADALWAGRFSDLIQIILYPDSRQVFPEKSLTYA